jgi:signal transduction histidine kinase
MVASELHEELAQLATAIRVDVDWLSSNVPQDVASLQQRTTHAMAMTDLLVTTIRRISFELHPSIIDDLGLDPALQEYCAQFSAGSGIACTYKSEYDESLLSKSASLDVFRICQEILAHIRQQHNATNVKVSLIQQKQQLILTVAEDATSFTDEDMNRIRQRAAVIHATCTISYDRKKGTSIIVELNTPK